MRCSSTPLMSRMNSKTLREYQKARPFNRFIIHLADGLNVPVDHPELMTVSPGGRTVAVYERDDSFHLLDVLLITDLEVPAESKLEDDGSE